MRPPPREPTTEEYRPSPAARADQGTPTLLAAFPIPVAFPVPASGEVIGRAWLAAKNIADTVVSGDHLRFHRAGGRVFVEDVSRNGTWLRGHKLTRGRSVPLSNGDVLRIGRTLLVYREHYEGPQTPEQPLGELVGPWGLGAVRAWLDRLPSREERAVLIEGPTGTGKELLAKEIARAFGREKNYLPLNVAAIPAGVFEAQLFGWIKGSHSDSGNGGPGVFRAHDGGAVFLDEIGDLPLDLQPKLLRLLEKGEVQPVGSPTVARVDVITIAATNRPLDEMVDARAFRRDLYERFRERITLPPLQDRPEDVPEIVRGLRRRRRLPDAPRDDEFEAMECLMLQSWAGNVRELERVLASAAPELPLSKEHVLRALGPRAVTTATPPVTLDTIREALEATGGNQVKAAERLGVDRGVVLRAVKKLKER